MDLILNLFLMTAFTNTPFYYGQKHQQPLAASLLVSWQNPLPPDGYSVHPDLVYTSGYVAVLGFMHLLSLLSTGGK